MKKHEKGIINAITQVTAGKFNTDAGSKSITYTDGTYFYTGKLTKNDEFLPDDLKLPDNSPGGNWTACAAAPSLSRSGLVRSVK